MTVRQLIKSLQDLGEDNLDREVIIIDDYNEYTPYKVEIITQSLLGNEGKVLIE